MIEVGLGFVIGIVILITLAFVGAHILENSKYEAAQIKKKAEIDAENLLYITANILKDIHNTKYYLILLILFAVIYDRFDTSFRTVGTCSRTGGCQCAIPV